MSGQTHLDPMSLFLSDDSRSPLFPNGNFLAATFLLVVVLMTFFSFLVAEAAVVMAVVSSGGGGEREYLE